MSIFYHLCLKFEPRQTKVLSTRVRFQKIKNKNSFDTYDLMITIKHKWRYRHLFDEDNGKELDETDSKRMNIHDLYP